VLESGGVYADSGQGRAQTTSIEVLTPLGSVRDIGTQFEVRVTDDSSRVRVREGAVEMEHPGGVEIARAGFEIEVDDAGNVRRGEVPIVGPDWEWAASIAPPFDLDGATLSEFLAWVSRETGLRVVYQDAAMATAAPGISLSGEVDGLSPREALAAVLPTCGMSHRVEGGEVFLSPGP
jgi:ferric-dicitrate binding protein FerR (iron transport regulator)